MARWLPCLAAPLLLATACSAMAGSRSLGLEDPCAEARAVARTGSVQLTNKGHYVFEEGKTGGGVAWGSYLDGSATTSNFGQLVINTAADYSDEEQMFAAGYLEGALTAPRIYDNYANMRAYFEITMNVTLAGPMKWIEEQDRWARAQCARQGGVPDSPGGDAGEGSSSPGAQAQRGGGRRFWRSVCLLLAQFDGMAAGYRSRYKAEANENVVGRMSYREFLFMHSNADLYDVIDMLDPSQGPTWSVQSGASPGGGPSGSGGAGPGGGGDNRRAARHAAWLEELRRDPELAAAKLFSDVALSGKCSALVKLAADLSDIWMGHSTWDTYTAALRIFKHYRFNLAGLAPAANNLSFSSYPGELFSDDDFYITSSGLVVLQTTNKIFNDEVFEALDPHSVLSWQRVRTANWLARDGQEWAAYLDTLNSGTYNNQYMIVDLNKFKPKVEAQAGLLWVAEQIPGLVVAADMTPTLSLGFWPSFNVPFFPEVYNASGYPDFISKVDKYGQHFGKTTHWLSYQASPRAKIFRRDQAAVTDLAGMKRIMRYNDWRNDPFSEGHPICAICGRGDLDPKAPVARGCYDTKVTSYSMALKMEAEAVNGPTVDQGELPPFDWAHSSFPDLAHRGQPRRFAFDFERMSAEVAEGAAGAGSCARLAAW